MTRTPNRNTIFNEQAEILDHQHLDGDQHLLRLHAPLCAEATQAGQFVHLQVSPLKPLRRPISLMRVNPNAGWIELLYKRLGEGTTLLSQRQIGEHLDCLGPIGQGFQPGRRRPLLLGGGVGMPPMIALAEQLKSEPKLYQPLAMLASEVPFPFTPKPSQFLLKELPANSIAAMPLLEEWGIPSRLASQQGYAGCFDGFITDLARYWLERQPAEALAEVEIFACGPHPMLQACMRLAQAFKLPCQISMEEHMACGIGGCAGCTIAITQNEGTSMKRVCVDGPVFDGYQVFPHL